MRKALSLLYNVSIKIRLYITTDLPEIIAPSSIPNPPGYTKPYKQHWTIKKAYVVARLTFHNYKQTWTTDPQFRWLRRGSWRDAEPAQKPSSSLEAFLKPGQGRQAVNRTFEVLRPMAQGVFATRGQVFTQSVTNFVEGYREGLLAAEREVGGAAEAQEVSAPQGGGRAKTGGDAT